MSRDPLSYQLGAEHGSMLYGPCRFHVHIRRYLSSRATSVTNLHRPRFFSSMGAIGTAKVDTTERLSRLRALMQQQNTNVGAVVVPSEDERECDPFSWRIVAYLDPDFSEYPAEADKRRGFISGFNGSAGDETSLMDEDSCSWVDP